MANTYPIITTPFTLAKWLAAVKQDTINISPGDTEAANILGGVDRQTRQFIYDFLASVLASDSTLLPAAIAAASVAGKVGGTSANTGGTQAAIIQGTVSTPDFRAQAVDTAALKDGAVTAAKLDAAALAGYVVVVPDGGVTTAKIVDANVTAAKLATGAVGATQLASNAVTTAKILDANVTIAKLEPALGAGYILVSGTTPFAFTAVPMSGAASISPTGVVSLATSGGVVLAEQATTGTKAGDSLATTKITRGASTNTNAVWVSLGDPQSLLAATPTTDGKIKLVAGTFLVEVSVPGQDVGLHRAFVEVYTSGGALQATLVGTSEQAGGTSVYTTRSVVVGSVTVPTNGYLLITHYTTAIATGGLGTALNVSPFVENYSMLKITRTS